MSELAEDVARLLHRIPGPLRRLRLESGGATVELEWPTEASAAPAAPVAVAEPGEDAVESPLEGHVIRSPMVGTFYRAPSPGAAPFVEVGTMVEPGQTVGIVEAMKLMNPLVSEVSGRVVEVLAGDGTGVEFDQPLITIELSET